MIAWLLIFGGVSVMACSAVGAAAVGGVLDRLHLLSVTTSVGFPLMVLGLIVQRGFSEASAMVVLIAALVLLSAPVMSPATARLTAHEAGVVEADSPP
ncbi:MAG: monovalent cation/H(+) antiporter subunit G [Mycobacterium sp.]